MSLLISGLSGIVLGVGLPHVVLSSRIARRTRKFVMLLPEALDLIVRGIRSGLLRFRDLLGLGPAPDQLKA